MAIFAGVPGMEVIIHQNGGATREYDNDEANMDDSSALSQYQASKTVSKYIEAHTGQEFSIEFTGSVQISSQMAILASLPGITVSILTVDSPQPLTEYPCEDEDDASIPAHLRPKTTPNYIQSSPNKYFSFKLDVGPPYLHDCPVLAFTFIINGADDGPAQLCSPAHLDDDEEHPRNLPKNELEALKKVGMVEVKVYRQNDSRIIKPKVQALTKSIREVSEKTNKGLAISHTVELDEGEPLDEETIYQDEAFMDGNEHPIGVFRFKYRSKEDLQKYFVLPRSPSSSPPPSPSPPLPPPPPPGSEDLSDKYVNNLAKRGHAEKERLKRMQSQQRRDGRIEFVATGFESLSQDEKKKLARDVLESRNGGPPIKMELERAGPAADSVAGQKRSRSIIVNETRLENGKLLLKVQDDDEEDIQATARARAIAIAKRNAAEEDDDVVFVSANPVQKTRAEMKNAARPRIKNEG